MATTPTPDGVLTVLNAANDSSTVVVSQNPPGGAVKRRGSSILDDSALGDEPQHVDMTFGKGLLPDEAKAEFRPGAMDAMDARRREEQTQQQQQQQQQQTPLETLFMSTALFVKIYRTSLTFYYLSPIQTQVFCNSPCVPTATVNSISVSCT